MTSGLFVTPIMKNRLFLCLLLAGCQTKNEQQSNNQPSSVTINGKEYADSVAVDSAGNRVRVKSGTAKVSGSNNQVDIK